MKRGFSAVVFDAPGRVSVRDFRLEACGPREIVVKTLYTMVSTGTETRVLAGHYGSADRFPLIPGYSVVGEVVETGEGVRGYRSGDLVSGSNPLPVAGVNARWGGQAGLHRYDADDPERPVILPPGACPLDYVITEIAAICLRGVDAAAPHPGEAALVIGQGLIGAFSAAWLQARGCRVVVTDANRERLKRARARGVPFAVDASGPDAGERISACLDGGADIVVESSGTPSGIAVACGALRSFRTVPGRKAGRGIPRLVVQANYLEPVPINFFDFFPGEGVALYTPLDRDAGNRRRAVDSIGTGLIRAGDFIDEVRSFREAPDAYAKLAGRAPGVFSLVFNWD